MESAMLVTLILVLHPPVQRDSVVPLVRARMERNRVTLAGVPVRVPLLQAAAIPANTMWIPMVCIVANGKTVPAKQPVFLVGKILPPLRADMKNM